MKCSICKKKEAIMHIREYTDNGVNKINLCLDCALKNGISTDKDNLNQFFKSLIKNLLDLTDRNMFILPQSMSNKYEKTKCPTCKSSFNDILKDGLLGCSTCYTVFSQVIEYTIYRYNHSLNYKGKLPLYIKEVKNNRTTLLKLKRQLKKSILEENFSDAAIIRDKIKALKKEIEKGVRKIAKK